MNTVVMKAVNASTMTWTMGENPHREQAKRAKQDSHWHKAKST